MTIILFLVDNSASMNQRTYLGTSLLDVAKGAVEQFLKNRQRDINSRGDRYMLLTFDPSPYHIKAGWKESHTIFANELKNLKATGLTCVGRALRNAFDLLNVNRLVSGVDTYGAGRCPFYLEPAVLICITDGNKFTNDSGVENSMTLPMNEPLPGSELTKEPFRWDQRLYALCLRIPGVPPPKTEAMGTVASDQSPIDVMCEATGGRSYCVTSQRVLQQCIESLVSKCQPGVVLRFEKFGPDPPALAADAEKENKSEAAPPVGSTAVSGAPGDPATPGMGEVPAWHSTLKMIYVQKSAQKGYSVGHWPLPESYWPDLTMHALPTRAAHPVLKFSCSPCEPMVIDNLPFDKYELEPSPLTQFILDRKQPTVCWQVFISNSAKYGDTGHPFGYLKASTKLDCVNLFVMPYNYPVLLPVLDELVKVHKGKPAPHWRGKFDGYLKTMPAYYALPVKRALQRMGIPQALVPESMEQSCLSFNIVKYLKGIKAQAKSIYDRMLSTVGQQQAPVLVLVKPRSTPSLARRKDLMPLLKDVSGAQVQSLKAALGDGFPNFSVGVIRTDPQPRAFARAGAGVGGSLNPFDVPRESLLSQTAHLIRKLSRNVASVDEKDKMHSVPVGQMGNYQEYLKRQPLPLREIEDRPVRAQTFGNPFKVNKAQDVIADEADVDPQMMKQQLSEKRRLAATSPGGGGGGGGPATPPRASSPYPHQVKRKGPLPRDFTLSTFREMCTPPNTPVHTPGSYEEQLVADLTDSIGEQLLKELEEQDLERESDVDEEPELVIVAEKLADQENDPNKIAKPPPVLNNHLTLPKEAEVVVRSRSETSSPASVVSGAAVETFYTSWEEMEEEHARYRTLICREIRKPGQDFSKLFHYLSSVGGSVSTRQRFVSSVMSEAARFKRRRLLTDLDAFRQRLALDTGPVALTSLPRHDVAVALPNKQKTVDRKRKWESGGDHQAAAVKLHSDSALAKKKAKLAGAQLPAAKGAASRR